MATSSLFSLWDSFAIVPASEGRSKCVATIELPSPGTLLLSSPPTSCVLVDSSKGKRCDECLRPLIKGRKVCGSCKEDVYCGTSCESDPLSSAAGGEREGRKKVDLGQTLAWNRHHKLLCRQLPSLSYKLKAHQLDEPSRLDTLLLARLAAEHFSTPDRIPSEIIKANTSSSIPSESLLPHELFLSLLPTHSLTSSSPIPSLLAPHLPPHLTAPELDLLLARFPTNNHSLMSQDSKLELYANVVLAGISRAANHSCSPSAVISCSWDGEGVLRVGLRTIRALEKGDEITISYLDPLLSLSTRQKTLQHIYDFTCLCPLCSSSSKPSAPPRPFPLPQPPPPPSSLTSLASLQTPPYPSNIPSSTTRIPITEAQLTKLTEAFGDAHHEGRWEEASKLGGQVLKVYWAGYGGWRPITATHLLSLSRVELNRSILLPLGDLRGRTCLVRSAMFVRWAREVGRVVWGEEVEGGEWEEELKQVESAVEAELESS